MTPECPREDALTLRSERLGNPHDRRSRMACIFQIGRTTGLLERSEHTFASGFQWWEWQAVFDAADLPFTSVNTVASLGDAYRRGASGDPGTHHPRVAGSPGHPSFSMARFEDIRAR